jgi:hypothetical protein
VLAASDPKRAGHEVFIEVKSTTGPELVVALTPGEWQLALQLEHKPMHTYMVLCLTNVRTSAALEMACIVDPVRLMREGRYNPIPCITPSRARVQLVPA